MGCFRMELRSEGFKRRGQRYGRLRHAYASVSRDRVYAQQALRTRAYWMLGTIFAFQMVIAGG